MQPTPSVTLASTTTASSDAALAARVAHGDRQAAAMLIERHQSAIRCFLVRLTGRADLADELAQETFLRLLRYAGHYDPAYPMRSWLLTIARRLSINHHKHNRRQILSEDLSHLNDPDGDPAPGAADRDERQHQSRRLAQALNQLTEPQRTAILLFHQQEQPIEAVARTMELPAGTVKSHLHRARQRLRTLLGQPMEAKP